MVPRRGLSLLKSGLARRLSGPRLALLSRWGAAGVILLILVYGLQDLPLGKENPESFTLPEQIQQAAELESLLGPQGRVQAIGDLSLLVLAERINLTPLIHLGPKHYSLFLHEPGGLEKILATIRQERPEAMVINARIWNEPWAQPFLEFAQSEYQNRIEYPRGTFFAGLRAE